MSRQTNRETLNVQADALFTRALQVASLLANEIDFDEPEGAYAIELHNSLRGEPARTKVAQWIKHRSNTIGRAVHELRSFGVSERTERALTELGL